MHKITKEINARVHEVWYIDQETGDELDYNAQQHTQSEKWVCSCGRSFRKFETARKHLESQL